MILEPPFAVGFLGAGQMATALAKGWLAAGLLDTKKSMASDPYPATREKFETATGLQTVAQNGAVVMQCDVLILAVKPHVLPDLLADIKPVLTANKIVISIAAGVTLDALSAGLGAGPDNPSSKLIRVMPNTPALVGASASAVSVRTRQPNNPDTGVAMRLFGAVGQVVLLPEHQLDAVTGLSGSGPAYVYVMIEALADGGVRMGLPRDVALKLAAQTVLGAAKMVLDTGTHPAALKDAVASPGGTTIAGLHELERGGLRGVLMDAVQAATERATELGRKQP
jgi:pyrroline-5-carboxylate reductase